MDDDERGADDGERDDDCVLGDIGNGGGGREAWSYKRPVQALKKVRDGPWPGGAFGEICSQMQVRPGGAAPNAVTYGITEN